ncbi:GNAT family N-acetyltransferase [Telluribacter sp. SYSU D00476]|uniref:GNAT family N-acetyltransferase n=1 Tax=Telluribacter sp. SYSU D00476 TaxID=2811430 RepID=UPI001FF3273C|nr:GNAT family N-acetyltransferase [Telluribacter sp. SYSU D00476]
MIHPLETERLILRNYTKEDLPYVHSLRAEPLVWKYSTITTTSSLADARVYLEDVLDKYAHHACGFQALFDKSTGQYIGEAGVMAFNTAGRKAVIGYNLLPDFWHKGYATEIVNALVVYLFGKIHVERVEALAVESNVASRKVLTKSGFVLEGVLRNYACIDSRFVNVCMYSMIRADYEYALTRQS